MQKFILNSPIKVIQSGNIPTAANLATGELAYGQIAGRDRLYGNIGGTITDLIKTTVEAVRDVSYNPLSGDWTISYTDGTPDRIINVPRDSFLASASYDSTTHILTLTMSDGSTVECDIVDLISPYIASSNGGLELINNNEFGIKSKGIVEGMISDALMEKINAKCTLAAATAQPVSVYGDADNVKTTINSSAVVANNGLKVINNQIDLDPDNIEIELVTINI